jgi:hypothetical protein
MQLYSINECLQKGIFRAGPAAQLLLGQTKRIPKQSSHSYSFSAPCRARDFLYGSLSFDKPVTVSFFETTIRLLGGLMSCYDLSGDQMFLDKALDLGNRLLPCFGRGGSGALNSFATIGPRALGVQQSLLDAGWLQPVRRLKFHAVLRVCPLLPNMRARWFRSPAVGGQGANSLAGADETGLPD